MDRWVAGTLLAGVGVLLAVWMVSVFGIAGGTGTLVAAALFGLVLLILLGVSVGAHERP